MNLTSLLQLADNLKQAGKIDNLNIFHAHLKYCQKLPCSPVWFTALSQLISISLFLEGEGGWELAEQ